MEAEGPSVQNTPRDQKDLLTRCKAQRQRDRQRTISEISTGTHQLQNTEAKEPSMHNMPWISRIHSLSADHGDWRGHQHRTCHRSAGSTHSLQSTGAARAVIGQYPRDQLDQLTNCRARKGRCRQRTTPQGLAGQLTNCRARTPKGHQRTISQESARSTH